MKRKSLCILLVLVLLLVASATAVTVAVAAADNNGKVYVHFYTGDGQYDYAEWEGKADVTWGSYYWIDTGRVVAAQGEDPDFTPDVEEGETPPATPNVGRLFCINLSASETKAVKQGKKLGLIMVRSYVDELNHLTPYWRQNTGKDLSSDRYLNVTLDANNEFHVWIIAGDKNNYLSLREAKSAFQRIEAAKLDDVHTLFLQATKAIKPEYEIDIYKVTDAIKNPDGELLYKGLKAASIDAENNKRCTVVLKDDDKGIDFAKDFDWHTDYKVKIEQVSAFAASVDKTRLYLWDEFQKECVPDKDTQLGVIYTPSATTFRLWAPISTNVVVNFYSTGDELDLNLARPAMAMEATSKGLWELTVKGDLAGVYYTYTNYVCGEAYETVDVYASAVGVNGNRAMVCDLDATDPVGWDQDLAKAIQLRRTNSDIGVIWEIHVRDFSISPDSGLMYKGKYLAFTESDTYVKGSDTLRSGIAYLQELGVTYVHLNPVYDFSTVDEQYINNTDYTTKQNWGYDPKNYNVPEGSYATDAEHGEVRITEFKQMVQALHNAGIGVIMDVVYNHTYTADSYFEKTVPGYYYRQALDKSLIGSYGYYAWSINALGAYNLSDGSGCSNETASERAMFRKYMVDSLVYWATEYHIDGFRFDLMAIHDVTTMNQIRAALDNIRDDKGNDVGGSSILLYGEPWAAGALGLDEHTGEKSACSDNLNDLDLRIAAFNDRMREGIKGNNDGGTGYVQGNVSGDKVMNRVKSGINGLFLKDSGEGTISSASEHAITYTTSHDNYTLWDQLVNTAVQTKSPTLYSEPNAVLVRKNMLAATLTLTSKGTSFILAGEEFGRTKYGNHNSYNAQDKINALDYNRQEDFGQLFDWYKGLIQLRTQRFTSISKGHNNAVVSDFYGCLVYTFSKEVSTDSYNRVTVMLNPYGYEMEIKPGEIENHDLGGEWTVIANQNGFDFGSTTKVSGNITLPPYSAYILVQ